MSVTVASALPQRSLSSKSVLWLVSGLGALFLLIQRISLGLDLPLWLDETWTAIIADQGSWSGFWREAWLDCNPPLYYLLMAFWTDAAGISNVALRLPSLFFLVSAAALPLVWRMPGLSREGHLTWGALLFFWWYSGSLAFDARAYSMLLFVCTAQTIAFARLLDRATLSRAFLWTGLASAAVLTHYYSLFVVAVQGAIYLHLRRKEAVRTWPALTAFIPSFGWLLIHLPRLGDYARDDVAWYVPVDVADALGLFAYVLGAKTPAFAVAAIVGLVATILLAKKRADAAPDEQEHGSVLWWVAASAALALAAAVAVAIVKPTLADRYLTGMVPPAMLGLVLIVRRLHGTHLAYAGLLAIYLAGSVDPFLLKDRLAGRSAYGFDRASAGLLATKPDQIIFAWDHPASKILDENSLRQLGGFFFERAGSSAVTVPVVLRLGEDPNKRLVSEATAERAGIIWLYNVARRSVARDYPPRIANFPGWRCHHAWQRTTGIVACHRE